MTASPSAQPSKKSGGTNAAGSLIDVLGNSTAPGTKRRRRENASPLPPDGVIAFPARGLDPLLTADDVAAILGIPRSFVYALARRGELPTVRIGDRYVRFRRSALEGWIEGCETTEPRGTQ